MSLTRELVDERSDTLSFVPVLASGCAVFEVIRDRYSKSSKVKWDS